MKLKRFNRILIISVLILGLSLSPVFAATQVDQETLYPLLKLPSDYALTTYNNGTTYMYRNNGVGYALGILGQVLSRSLYQVVSNTNSIYTAVDGVEGSLSTISGKIKDYTSYIDGLETAFGINNSRLQSILTAIQGITTYNYTSVLNSILSNTNYLPTIESDLQVTNDALGSSDTGIWGAVNGASHHLGLIQPDIANIWDMIDGNEITTNWAWHDTTLWRDVSSSYLPLLNLNSHAYLNTYPYQSSNLSFRGLLTAIIRQQYFTATAVRSTGANQYIRGYLNNSQYNEGQPTSVMDALQFLSMALGKPLGRLQYYFADDDTIQRKEDNAAISAAALDGFTGSGSAAASVSDITAVKDSVGSLKDATSGGASFSQAFNAFSGDCDGWSWFSQENADAMDTTGSGSHLLRSSSDSSYPYLGAYYRDIFSILGGGDVND